METGHRNGDRYYSRLGKVGKVGADEYIYGGKMQKSCLSPKIYPLSENARVSPKLKVAVGE